MRALNLGKNNIFRTLWLLKGQFTPEKLKLNLKNEMLGNLI
jgi:hypothetical protein